MDQILVVNKPTGWTSHDVVQKVRRILKVKKVGHAGTLDPMATGVLLVLVGKETKKQQKLMRLSKEYLAEVTFGCETDTYDAEGQVLKSAKDVELKEITFESVERALGSFRGQIIQKVPSYSA
ncbi:tRNA pseudouridine(55) synthase TruB, partial [Patescibacteria group bacterium]|nr:tRNA pseudouridine(55) synthase TruB [Patescibacteria group bacterium]MBU1868597.1 tRNA pseudouridine(55) synthase TruB [Patescibacteria group bacterium]